MRAKKQPLEVVATPPAIVIPETRESIQAPYRFSDQEIARMNIDLRAALSRSELLEEQKKASMQDFKLRIQNAENDAKLLRNKLDQGEETRAFVAAVEFDPKRSKKRYLDPVTGAFIREEDMTPADWQLPMFKPDAKGQEVVAAPTETDAPKGKRKAKAPAFTEPGQTNMGNALDAAASMLNLPKIAIDLDKADWSITGLVRSFKAAAKKADWPVASISLMNDRLHECADLEAMIQTLKPHVVGAEESQPSE